MIITPDLQDHNKMLVDIWGNDQTQKIWGNDKN